MSCTHNCGPAAESMETTDFNIRCWQYAGDTALSDVVRGLAAGVCNDGRNKPGEAEFGNCMAIVFCRHQGEYWGHLAEITGRYEGDVTEIWPPEKTSFAVTGLPYRFMPVTDIKPIPAEVIGTVTQGGISRERRPAVVHFLLAN